MKLDHYSILGLPSGVAGAKLSLQQIIKAYKLKALKLHPDKRRNDPNAHKNFQRLQNSYDILKDKKSREAYDVVVRVKHEKILQEKRMTDLKKKELAEQKARDEEEGIARKFKSEIAKIRAMHASKETSATWRGTANIIGVQRDGQFGLEKENMLQVSWDKVGDYYSAQRLRELFQEFGEVRCVLITSCKTNEGSAFIVMASKDAAIEATRSVIGDPNNPLLVLPILRPVAVVFPIDQQYYLESQSPELSTSVGTRGYQAFEASVFAKLRRTEEGLLKGKKRKLKDNDGISKHQDKENIDSRTL